MRDETAETARLEAERICRAVLLVTKDRIKETLSEARNHPKVRAASKVASYIRGARTDDDLYRMILAVSEELLP
jgi:hypothetical protein